MKNSFVDVDILAQNVPEFKPGAEFRQLELFPLAAKRQKPQISSIPGTHPLERNRYQVTVGSKAIASELDADDASQLAKLIEKRQLTALIEFLEQRGILNQQVQVFLLSAIGGEG
jgi:hypothetical protein